MNGFLAYPEYRSQPPGADNLGDPAARSDIHGRMGWVYWRMGDYDEADRFHQLALESAEQIDDLPSRARLYLEQAVGLAKEGDMEYALRFFEKGMEVLERSGDPALMGRGDRAIGDRYIRALLSQFTNRSGSADGNEKDDDEN